MVEAPLTVGQLREIIANLPDETPLIRPGRGDLPITTAGEGLAYWSEELQGWFRTEQDVPHQEWGQPRRVLFLH